jgi:hypothetical protein
MSHLGHMAVGNHWTSNQLGRGLPNLLKEVMGAEPLLPYIHPGKTAKQILFTMKFNHQLEKALVNIAEESAQATPRANKIMVPTLATGDLQAKSPQSIHPKDKYQLARKLVEDKYKKSYVEKPWAYMYCYYSDEDRARLSGGVGYVGHHGGGDLKVLNYHDFVQTVIYPMCFLASLITVSALIILYYVYFGTFMSGRKHRYD